MAPGDPAARPVPARDWRGVWLRARAALCPEADPACKDPSRAYWLPSHNGGVTARATWHDGPLLDPRTLPELPPEPQRPDVPARMPRRGARADWAQAYMRKVIDNLATVAPGGRNAALNGAAWTLGKRVAAGC